MKLTFWLRSLAPLALALAAVLSSSSAFAQSPADLKKARAQFQRAIELEQAGNFSEAISQFREVGQVKMTPHVRFHIAFCEEGLGRLVTALGGYELAHSEADQVGSDFKAEVDAAVSQLKERIPKLVIERGTGADAATVQLDGVDLGASSIGVEVPLDPGPHSVVAVAPGYKQFTTTAELKEREVTRVVLELEVAPEPEPAAAPPPKEIVVIRQEPPPDRLVPYVIGGAGIAALIGSGVFFVLKQTTEAELEKNCPNPKQCSSEYKDTHDRLTFYYYAAPIAAGVGVAAIGVSVYMLYFRKPKKPAATKAASLAVVPGGPSGLLGATVTGTF